MHNNLFDTYPDVVTHADLCSMLKISRGYAYQLLRTGAISHMKVGKKYLIPKENVIRFVQQKLA